MNTLPNEIIQLLGLKLDLISLRNLLQVSARFYQLFSRNYFWYVRFKQDFEFLPEKIGSWKELYQNYVSVITFGPKSSFDEFRSKEISSGTYHSAMIDLKKRVCVGFMAKPSFFYMSDLNKKESRIQLPIKAQQVVSGGNLTLILDFQKQLWEYSVYSSQLRPILSIQVKKCSTSGYHTIINGEQTSLYLCSLCGKNFTKGKSFKTHLAKLKGSSKNVIAGDLPTKF